MNQVLSFLVFLVFFEGTKNRQDMFNSLSMIENIDALVFACTRVPCHQRVLMYFVLLLNAKHELLMLWHVATKWHRVSCCDSQLLSFRLCLSSCVLVHVCIGVYGPVVAHVELT